LPPSDSPSSVRPSMMRATEHNSLLLLLARVITR
jgi:hypothetical protein